jgi:Amiloride-sensitive sodium channel
LHFIFLPAYKNCLFHSSQADADRADNLTLDFHYQSANLVKYRTDITFGWLDLMVSFGGIAGLFLGCSILSAVEIIYYLILIFMVLVKRLKMRLDKKIRKHTKTYEKRKFRDNLQVVKVIPLTSNKNKSRF